MRNYILIGNDKITAYVKPVENFLKRKGTLQTFGAPDTGVSSSHQGSPDFELAYVQLLTSLSTVQNLQIGVKN